MIAIRNLSRRYGPVVAVDDVSLSIERGEIVGLLGHNGAGKTTVMKMLTGFLDATSGTITVGGVDIAADRAGVQRQIGYLPENAPLYPEMLVQEYLFMIAELRGVPATGAAAAVGEAVAQTGLHKHLMHPIGTLSKGYRQRVGIAQAIVHKPQVLVLDEPTNGLDPMQIQTIRDLIRRLGATTTIILSTHILQEIEAVCDRVLVMINGKLVADSPIGALLQSAAIRVVARGEGIERGLNGLPAVGNVRRLGPDEAFPGYDAWAVDATGAAAVDEIVAAGAKAGWKFAAVAPEHKSLETVFRELQAQAVRGVAS
jgi:ABC-2 type transport system ATP-binding protein